MAPRRDLPQSSLPVVEEPFLARNLFSNHFLKERLPREDPRWRREEERNLEAFDRIKKLYQRVRPAEKEQYQRNEANLEKDFIRPILDILGHSYDVQESIHFTYRGPERPDYTLFPSEEVRRVAEGDSKKYLTAVIALAEAKAWDLVLDKTAKVGPARYANPSLQINNYLRDANITWGILTNGRRWRLYNNETSLHLDSYYEVDLVELVERGSPEDFKYFYLFFRREAFVREASVPSFLDDIFTGSIRYAKELEEDVKENVYDALRLLIKGFLEHPDNRLERTDLERIHENSLILLYRLLFVLYAEAKGLLPSKNPLYRDMSLERLREDINRELHKPVPTLTVAGDSYWARVAVLFRLVNLGSEARNIPREHLFVPPYNGGLFDPTKHQFLETAKVGDGYLAQALHLLSWSDGKNGRQAGFVDYTTLSIRHLGSIYEGLLEYQPMIAEDDLIVVQDKGVEVFRKVSDVRPTPKRLRNLGQVPKGDVYLRTDKGERKATGSYYTPDYVVKHIVENTLGPLVEEIRGRGLKGTDFVREVLSLKVLDPAMGSGHFLVEATSFLAARVVESLAEAEEGTQSAAEEEVLWARREVARRCIYGVDINPLAVELAKVSLWLHTVTKDKPLSFLDHHLKCGNSLVGTQLVDLPWYPEPDRRKSTSRIQKVDLEGPKPFINKLLETVKRLELTPDETLQQVKEKERIFKELQETPEYQKIRALCDVRTSLFFGNALTESQYQNFVSHVFYGSRRDWKEDGVKGWFRDAVGIAERIRLFHWELEFPEAFHASDRGRAGFDAVIGNPPYVRLQGMTAEDVDYFNLAYDSAFGNYDIYLLFVERGIGLLAPNGRFGLILPNKFFVAEYGVRLRKWLIKERMPYRIVDFGDNQIFGPVTTYTNLLFVRRAPNAKLEYLKIRPVDASTLEHVLGDLAGSTEVMRLEIPLHDVDQEGAPWTFFVGPVAGVLTKLSRLTPRLGEVADIFVGLQTSADPIYIVEIIKSGEPLSVVGSKTTGKTHEIETTILKPILRGAEIRRYYIEPRNYALVFPYGFDDKGAQLLTEKELTRNFPHCWQYLLENKARLLERADAERQPEWWRFVYPKNLESFEQPKLLTQVLASRASFAVDSEGRFYFVGGGNAGGYGIVPSEQESLSLDYLAALLNSRLLDLYLQSVSTHFQNRFFSYARRFIERLPIYKPKLEPRTASTTGDLQVLLDLVREYLTGRDAAVVTASFREHLARGRDRVIHDFLAELARTVRGHLEQARDETEGFLTYLQRNILREGVALKHLRGVKALHDYSAKSFEEFLATLRDNQSALSRNLNLREGQERLEDEFIQSTKKVRENVGRSRLLEKLIDQLVFALYGLSESDIHVIMEYEQSAGGSGSGSTREQLLDE